MNFRAHQLFGLLLGSTLGVQIFGLTGCSLTPIRKAPLETAHTERPQKDSRTLASHDHSAEPSAAEVAGFEEDFSRILNSPTTEKRHLRIQIHLDALEELYFRSHSFLKKFDQTLDQHTKEQKSSIGSFYTEIVKSGTYPHLLALHDRTIHKQHLVIHHIESFLKIVSDSLSSREEIKNARDALNYIGDYYQHLPLNYLIAHYPVGRALKEEAFKDPGLQKGLERLVYGKLKNKIKSTEISKFLRRYQSKEIRQKIAETAELTQVKVTAVAQAVEEDAQAIESELSAPAPGRYPQSEIIAPGTGPQGNVTGNTFTSGVWSLTFDDGPHEVYTQKILQNLHDQGMRATFFMLAQQASAYPEIARAVKNAQMETANHSYTHAQLPKLSEDRLNHEIHDSTDKLAEVLGERPALFRCPYGSGVNVSRVRSLIAQEKMVHVFWNVDSLDWQDHNPESIVARVKKQMALSKKGGGVILFHDIHLQTIEASKKIMEYLNEKMRAQPGQIRPMPVGDAIQLVNQGG